MTPTYIKGSRAFVLDMPGIPERGEVRLWAAYGVRKVQQFQAEGMTRAEAIDKFDEMEQKAGR